MACTKEELRERIRTSPVAKNGKVRFSGELRRDIVEYSKAQMGYGRSQNSIAQELGMNGWTLSRWLQKRQQAGIGGESAFIEVSATKSGRRSRPSEAAVEMSAFEVTCPSGFEVRVPWGFETSALQRLLLVLEGR
jgi:transposase-like protein